MKTYLKLLTFSGNFPRFITLYFFITILVSFFSLANLGLLIPLLDILFGSEATTISAQQELLVWNDFDGTTEFLKEYLYQEFALLIQNKGKLNALAMICIMAISSSLLTNVFRYVAKMLAEHYRAGSIVTLRDRLFDNILRLDIGFLTDRKKSDIIARNTTDMTETEIAISSFITFIKDPIAIILYFSFLILLSWQMTLFVILILPLSAGVITFITKKLRKKSHELQKKNGDLIGVLDESLVGMRIVKGFNADAYAKKTFGKYNSEYASTFLSLSRRVETASPFSEVMGVFFVCVLLYYGGGLVLGDTSSFKPGEFIGFIAIFTQVLTPVKSLSNNVSKLQRGIASTERIFELIETEPKVTDGPEAIRLESFEKGISLEDVHFSYGDKQVIHGVSFEIKKGETVALVGASGGGKSTIADFIPRFYDVNTGRVSIDGKNIKDYTLASLRSHMGIVTQEPILFNDTVYNNIAFGNEELTEEEVIRAAKIANAHSFIKQLENGYHTTIGDRGLKLSGGQRQRLSIARAVVSNPEILILDEATSALDTESEKLVQEAIQHLMKGRTSLVIAHRLSTIQEADKIIVLNAGKIVEVGTHDELIAKENGEYRKLQEMQGYGNGNS